MKNRHDILQQIRDVAALVVPVGGTVWLYGSQARGNARAGSDWDLLVLLEKEQVEKADYDSISYPLTALGWQLEEAIVPVIYTHKEWAANSFTPFYKNVERDKIIVYEFEQRRKADRR